MVQLPLLFLLKKCWKVGVHDYVVTDQKEMGWGNPGAQTFALRATLQAPATKASPTANASLALGPLRPTNRSGDFLSQFSLERRLSERRLFNAIFGAASFGAATF